MGTIALAFQPHTSYNDTTVGRQSPKARITEGHSNWARCTRVSEYMQSPRHYRDLSRKPNRIHQWMIKSKVSESHPSWSRDCLAMKYHQGPKSLILVHSKQNKRPSKCRETIPQPQSILWLPFQMESSVLMGSFRLKVNSPA